MAREFSKQDNAAATRAAFAEALRGNSVDTSSRTSNSRNACRRAIGLIRTGDTVQYANLILESALMRGGIRPQQNTHLLPSASFKATASLSSNFCQNSP